jgi:hypothetical protein
MVRPILSPYVPDHPEFTSDSAYENAKNRLLNEISEAVAALLNEDKTGWAIVSEDYDDDGPGRSGGTNYYLQLGPGKDPLVRLSLQTKGYSSWTSGKGLVFQPYVGSNVFINGLRTDLTLTKDRAVYNALVMRLMEFERKTNLDPLQDALAALRRQRASRSGLGQGRD